MTALRATYTSPSGTHDFALPISDRTPADLAQANISEQTAHLAKLRDSVKTMQTQINQYITQKMEEDVRAAAAAALTTSGSKPTQVRGEEDLAEQNYGEEPEEDSD